MVMSLGAVEVVVLEGGVVFDNAVEVAGKEVGLAGTKVCGSKVEFEPKA